MNREVDLAAASIERRTNDLKSAGAADRGFHIPTEIPAPAPARTPPGAGDWAS